MIHYLIIENFSAINGAIQINFEATNDVAEEAYEVAMPDKKRLLKLAYIFGANASGKTTVLKAFEFLRKLLLQPLNDKASELDFDPFLFQDQPNEKPSRFELSFYADGQRYVYEVKFNRQAILFEKIVFYNSIKPTEVFSRTTDLDKRLAKVEFGSRIKIASRDRDLLEGNTLHNNTVIGGYSKTNVDIAELEILARWFSTYLMGMISSDTDLTEITATYADQNPVANRWINTFLNKADHQLYKVDVSDHRNLIEVPLETQNRSNIVLQGKYSRDTTIRPTPSKKFYGGAGFERKIDFYHKLKSGKEYSLSLSKESSGTKRYFGLGAPLFELIHNNHMLCIDELETSLHPDLMTYFLQVFLINSVRSQMLITTHNTGLMENLDFIRKDALWFSEKNDQGSIDLYSASDFDSSTLRKGASIVKAYKSGRLGAKPNLGSPHIIED